MATTRSSRKSAATTPRGSTTPTSRRWSSEAKTDSTKPAPGLFKKSARDIAEGLAKKSVSPEGPGQGMRMLNFYENRAGKNLSQERKRTLEHARELLHEKVTRSHEAKSSKAAAKSKKTA